MEHIKIIELYLKLYLSLNCDVVCCFVLVLLHV